MSRVLVVIPARYASTRFPGKPLAPLGDRSMLETVWSRVRGAKQPERIVIATDDRRIADAADGFGAETMLTSTSHASGTDRVAEAVERLDGTFDVVINVQADEPLITPTSLDALASVFLGDGEAGMATLAEPIERIDDLFDPNVVKLVVSTDGHALFFSRAPIPYHRGDSANLASDFREALRSRPGGLRGYRRHQGIYAYTPEALRALTALDPSPLEIDEGLEQLRALEAGIPIRVVDSDYRSQAVDTPADLERVAHLLGFTETQP